MLSKIFCILLEKDLVLFEVILCFCHWYFDSSYDPNRHLCWNWLLTFMTVLLVCLFMSIEALLHVWS